MLYKTGNSYLVILDNNLTIHYNLFQINTLIFTEVPIGHMDRYIESGKEIPLTDDIRTELFRRIFEGNYKYHEYVG